MSTFLKSPIHCLKCLKRISLLLIVFCACLAPLLAKPRRAGAAAAAAIRIVPVTGSLQAAVAAAQSGDVLQLQAITYTGRVEIDAAGAPNAPIIIQGMGRGMSALAGKLVFALNAAYWVLQDFDVNAAGYDDGARLNAPVHDITLQRMHLYGGTGYGVRVGDDTQKVLIQDCEIDHFNAGTADAHGVGIMTANDVTVRRCNIHDDSGDAIQSNTPDYPGYGRWASNIVIEYNLLHDCRENALDIKSTHGLVARFNQAWGFHVVNTSSGMAIEVQYDAQDITLLGNQVWNAVEGIDITRGKKNGVFYPLSPQRVTIAGNWLHDIVADPAGDSANGSGISARSSSGVKIYNNTILHAARMGMYVGQSATHDFPAALDVRNNVFDGQLDDLDFGSAPALVPGLIVDHNHYVTGLVNGNMLSAWLAAGYERRATSGDPLLDSRALPLASSPLIDSGIPVGLLYFGSAPDRGWGELSGWMPIPPPGPWRAFLPLAP